LVGTFGSPEAVLTASPESLAASGLVSRAVAETIARGPAEAALRAVDRELSTLERLNMTVVTILDPGYPIRLKTIPDPPPILYVSGALDKADDHAVAIVGSRNATAPGRVLTEELSRDLASRGFTIVSGMARGVDAAAHRGALVAKGRTVAVLGCGVDRTYPTEHHALRKQIESNGAVISELPVGSYPHAYHFPRRNRLISGMCFGVLVTEATRNSGSLITARLAADQGREVFAVPGSIKAETSRGSNGLIKQGAKLVETVEDIVEELLPQLDAAFRDRMSGRAEKESAPQPGLNKKEIIIRDLLAWDPVHIDELIRRSGLSAADVSEALLSMELKGFVHQLPGSSFIRI
jgi:DNA processing protein